MKFFLFEVGIAIVLLAGIGCGQQKNPYENKAGIDPLTLAQMDTANYTEIKWIDTLINIDRISKADTVELKFRFKNVGNGPLFILNVQPACGCTVTDYSKEPVWKGEEGVIRAMYKWNGQVGKITKTIGVHTNTRNSAWHTLTFNGYVDTTKN